MNHRIASAIVSLILIGALAVDADATPPKRNWAKEVSSLEELIQTKWSEAMIRDGRKRDFVFLEATNAQEDFQHDSDLTQNAKYVAICRFKVDRPWFPEQKEKKQLTEQQLLERRNARRKWFAKLVLQVEPGKLAPAEVEYLTSSEVANYDVFTPTLDSQNKKIHELRIYAASPEEAKNRMIAFIKAIDFGHYAHLQMLNWRTRAGHTTTYQTAMLDFQVQLATYESLDKVLQQNKDPLGMCGRTYFDVKYRLESCKKSLAEWDRQKENGGKQTDSPQTIEMYKKDLTQLTETLASFDDLLAKAKSKHELIDRVQEAEQLCHKPFSLAWTSAYSASVNESEVTLWKPSEVIDNKIIIQPLASNPLK